MEKEFDISGIEIETLTLERMFVDKLFATEFYYLRNMFTDTSKHLYDLSVLFKTAKIQKLFNLSATGRTRRRSHAASGRRSEA